MDDLKQDSLDTKRVPDEARDAAGLAAATGYPVLRCPFCGSTANQPNDISPIPNAGTWWEVMCADDNKIGCNAWRSDESPELAVEKWNTRAYPWLPDAALLIATSMMVALGSRDAQKRLALAKAIADDIETAIRRTNQAQRRRALGVNCNQDANRRSLKRHG